MCQILARRWADAAGRRSAVEAFWKAGWVSGVSGKSEALTLKRITDGPLTVLSQPVVGDENRAVSRDSGKIDGLARARGWLKHALQG